MIDSHCHLDRLDLNPYNGSLDAALAAARSMGVKGFLCIGIGFDRAAELIELQARHQDVWLTLGVHPLDHQQAVDTTTLMQWCSRPEVIAVGETGLDYHYQPETRQLQLESFAQHLAAADELGKPVIVHTRAAQDDTLELMRHQRSDSAGVLHCFTESWEMASQALDMGYYVSISGIVTFRNAGNVREVAKKIPLDRLLIETDAPYLAPVPYRGKSNEPAYLVNTAGFLADLRGLSLDQLIEATTDNFYRLFPSARAADQALAVNS